MTEQKAIFYGKIELIPGIICDGYVLENETTVMSERGTADLLGIRQYTLQSMTKNWPPKTLKGFINKDLSMTKNSVEVLANNSPYRGRKIIVYTSTIIESLIRAYAFAFANDKLRENQKHIVKRCVFLMAALARTALDAAIREACGSKTEIQKTVQENYVDVTKLIKEFGFSSSIDNIATKKDIVNFLNIPESTLNSFLRRHSNEIKPIKLDSETIQSLGLKAKRLNGYQEEDVAKIAFGMDTEIGIKLKKRMFGQVGAFVKAQVRTEIHWRQVFSKVLKGFGIKYNYPIGKYRVDYFVPPMELCLECNGYDCHKNYDKRKESERTNFLLENYAIVRFHHEVNIETLFNAILQAEKGKIIKLYDVEEVCNRLQIAMS